MGVSDVGVTPRGRDKILEEGAEKFVSPDSVTSDMLEGWTSNNQQKNYSAERLFYESRESLLHNVTFMLGQLIVTPYYQ